jgi:cytochrome c oxidase subunit IV
MKAALPVIGVLAILMGLIWVLQGINILPGSFMTGDIRWAIIGVVLIIGGGFLVARTVRSRAKTS